MSQQYCFLLGLMPEDENFLQSILFFCCYFICIVWFIYCTNSEIKWKVSTSEQPFIHFMYSAPNNGRNTKKLIFFSGRSTKVRVSTANPTPSEFLCFIFSSSTLIKRMVFSGSGPTTKKTLIFRLCLP